MVVLLSLAVFSEQDTDGTYIVHDKEFLVYGVGATLSEAWCDYAVSLVEYFEMVERQAEQSDATRPLLERLQRMLDIHTGTEQRG